jgi:type I restriction enzyme M protein
MSNPSQLVQKLWNYCNILRDDGLSYGDYVEQLTFLLFLKMADEQARPPFNKSSPIPKAFGWDALLKLDGDELETHYRHTLAELGKRSGMLGVIFRKAQNKIQDPAKLRRLIVDLIDKEQWSSLSADVTGDAYEGLLQKNAEDVKGGAGQYFTPRALIERFKSFTYEELTKRDKLNLDIFWLKDNALEESAKPRTLKQRWSSSPRSRRT